MPAKHRSQTRPILGQTLNTAFGRIEELERALGVRGGGVAGGIAGPVAPVLNIQGGAVQSDVDGKITVTFNVPFDDVPAIVASLVHANAWDPLIHVILSVVSKTGFEGYVVQISPQGSDPLSTWGAGGHEHGPGSYKFPATPTWGAGDHSHGVTGQTTVPEGTPGGAAGTYSLANGATDYLGSHTHPIPEVSIVGTSEPIGAHTHPIGDVFKHNHGVQTVSGQTVNWIAVPKTQ